MNKEKTDFCDSCTKELPLKKLTKNNINGYWCENCDEVKK